MIKPAFKWLSLTATLMTLGIIALGAFVRLSDAGLGCPDWPTCYGHVLWPQNNIETTVANISFNKTPVDKNKTWPEQVHRLFASSLGLLTLVLFALAFRLAKNKTCRHFCLATVTVSQVLLFSRIGLSRYWKITDVPIYDAFDPAIAIGVTCLLISVIMRLLQTSEKQLLLATLAVVMIVAQGLFGMWTVTLKLWPQVVTLHLLGGMTLVVIFSLTTLPQFIDIKPLRSSNLLPFQWLKPLGFICLSFVLMQIILGGWVSANYAAVACADFPTCQGMLWPDANFRQGFDIFQRLGPNYLGGQLHSEARAAIHVVHRLGALVVSVVCMIFFAQLWRVPSQLARTMAIVGFGILVAQVGIGVANILLSFPLSIAILHNLFAALLLLSVVTANYWVYSQQSFALRSQYA